MKVTNLTTASENANLLWMYQDKKSEHEEKWL